MFDCLWCVVDGAACRRALLLFVICCALVRFSFVVGCSALCVVVVCSCWSGFAVLGAVRRCCSLVMFVVMLVCHVYCCWLLIVVGGGCLLSVGKIC